MTRESVELAILHLYQIDRETLYANNLGRETALVSTIRYLYWFILKKYFGLNADTIAKQFNRTPRGVYKGISQVEWGVQKMKYYSEPYNKIIEAASK